MLPERFARLLAAAQVGDEDAFGELWRDTNPVLLRYLRVRAPGLAEDVAAEAWIGAMRGLSDFRGDHEGFRAWLVTIARNRLTDSVRRAARRPEALTDSWDDVSVHSAPDAADAVLEQESTERALQLIAELAPDVAEMVLLRVVVGLDVAQVAAVVGRKPGTVRVAVHRGLRRLATLLAQRDVTPARTSTFEERDV